MANPNGNIAGHLQEEHLAQQTLFEAQPPLVQRFLEAQGRQLAEALAQREPPSQVRFSLPDKVVVEAHKRGESKPVSVPVEFREQLVGGLIDRLARGGIRTALRQRLSELDQSLHHSVAVSARLIRYATVMHIVHHMLPSGRSVTYIPAEGEEIPSIPVSDELEPESAITATTDAIAEEGQAEESRGELQVPYTPAARRFYLPRWVAFDDEGRLLVNSVGEAEAHVTSMQRFLSILHLAAALAPYIFADEDYQRKRYGMLGQLINQGRALARHQVGEIIQTIKQRAVAKDLNRGLSLSLPYFDDQSLEMKLDDFEVIPAGRIMFVPAFVVRAAREEQAKVAQDTRLSHSTRIHLLAELKTLEEAFETPHKSR